jgi:hypothetical protein
MSLSTVGVQGLVPVRIVQYTTAHKLTDPPVVTFLPQTYDWFSLVLPLHWACKKLHYSLQILTLGKGRSDRNERAEW